MDNFGNPDVGMLQALYTSGEWVMEPFNRVREHWSNNYGYIDIYSDGSADLWTKDNNAFTMDEIIGFAMLRGLIKIKNCVNCGMPTIHPQRIETPCTECGFWSGENS